MKYISKQIIKHFSSLNCHQFLLTLKKPYSIVSKLLRLFQLSKNLFHCSVFRVILFNVLLFLFFVGQSNAARWQSWTGNVTYPLSGNLTIENRNDSGRGGALYVGNNAQAIINGNGNLSFLRNYTNGGYGGAVAVEGASTRLTINLPNNTVEFSYNSAWGGPRDHGGGAIWVSGGATLVINSRMLRMTNNKKINSGGDNNVSGGGAIKAFDRGKIYIQSEKMIFANNISDQDGPGGMLGGSSEIKFEVSVSSVEFSNGVGQYNSVIYIYNDSNILTFNSRQTFFINNYASGSNWGALAITGSQNNRIVFDPLTNGWGNIVFIGNTVSGGRGSVIVVDGSNNNVSIKNSTLTAINNYAGRSGGVIDLSAVDSNMLFDNVVSSFTDNRSPIGAIISLSASNSRITFNNGQMIFTGNTSTNLSSLGTINVAGTLELINISIMKGSRNTAGSGGFLYIPNNTFNFTGTLMEMNSNRAVGSGSYGLGGAFYFTNSNVTFSGSIINFIGNSAEVHGGAMYITGSASNRATYSASSMTFEGNIAATGKGGGIYITGEEANFNVNGSITFRNNRAATSGQEGGAIYFNSASATFRANQEMKFLNNTAGGAGGAIYFNNSRAFFPASKELQFIGNRSLSGDGGAMYFASMLSPIPFAPSSMTFRGNIAGVNGGGIYFNGVTVSFLAVGNASMSFIGNIATGGSGGAIYMTNSSATFGFNREMIFNNNTAGISGGAIFLGNNSRARFISVGTVTFEGNRLTAAGSSGTAIFVDLSTLVFTASFMSFEKLVGEYGSVLYARNSSYVSFSGGVIDVTSNTSTKGKGVISWDSGASLEFTNVTLLIAKWNQAASGGFLDIERANFVLGAQRIDITSNTATNALSGSGGAMYLSEAKLSFASPEIPLYYNVAASSGGAIYADRSTIVFDSPGTISLIGNKAKYGGAVYATNNSSVIFSRGEVMIEKNESTDGGGVVSWGNNTYVAFIGLPKLTAILNKAAWGGFLSIDGANFTLEANEIMIASNTATKMLIGNGGGIYLNRSTMTFRNVSMLYNTAMKDGGGIYATNGSSLTFSAIEVGKELLIKGNLGDRGGGLFASSKTTIRINALLADIKFTGNTARTGEGHEIYLDDAKVEFRANPGRTIEIEKGMYGVNGSIIDNVGGGKLYMSGNNYFDGISSFGVVGGGVVEVINATFTYIRNNGSLYAGGSSSMIFKNSTITFERNNSFINGGSLFATDDSKIVIEYSIVDFASNTSLRNGGAIYVDDMSTVTLRNSRLVLLDYNVAMGSGGFVSVGSYGRMEFIGITELLFIGNTAQYGGGVIFLEDRTAKLGISEIVRLRGDRNKGKDGGFAYLKQQEFNFAKMNLVSFSSNSAVGIGGQEGRGGVFYLDETTITLKEIDELTFRYNYALSSGGVMYIIKGSKVSFEDFDILTFERNTSIMGGGGGIYIDDTSKLEFKNIYEIRGLNNVGGSGGFVYLTGQRYEFNSTNMEIIGNTAVTGSGGGVYLKDTEVIFNGVNINIINNTAEKSGGGAYIPAGSTMIFNNIYILDFRYNEAKEDGGALYANNARFEINNVMELSGVKNTGGNGGFFFLGGRDLELKDMNIHVTSNISRMGGSGGGIYISQSTLIFNRNDIEFIGNEARANPNAINIGANGGAVVADNKARIEFNNNNLIFKGNKADNGGGGIYIDNGSKVIIKRSGLLDIVKNSAGAGGGVFVNAGSEFIVEGEYLKLEENRAGLGGAVYINERSTAIFKGIEKLYIRKNVATSSGGGIYINGEIGRLIIGDMKELEFSGNTAGYEEEIGWGVNVSTRWAGGSGGAIYADDRTSKMEIVVKEEIRGIRNTGESGGFAFLTNQEATFDGKKLTINRNEARGGSGGGIYISTTDLTLMNKETKITENTALRDGGAIYAKNSRISLQGENSIVSGSRLEISANKAVLGGGIYAERTEINFNEEEILIKDNDVDTRNNSGSGGGLYLKGSTVVFGGSGTREVRFINNVGDHFGAIYVEDSVIKFEDLDILEFRDNDTMSGGSYGGVFGSGIGTGDGSVIEISNIDKFIAHNNRANRGGFLYVNEAVKEVSIRDIEAIRNTAREDSGGAIYVGGANKVDIGDERTKRRIDFIGNEANMYGGAIYAGGITTVSINARITGADVLFKDNKAGRVEGGKNDIYIAEGAVVSFNAEGDERGNRKIELYGGLMGEGGSIVRKEGLGLLYLSGYVSQKGTFYLNAGLVKIDGRNTVEHRVAFGNLYMSAFTELDIQSLGQDRTITNISGEAEINGKLTIGVNVAKGEADNIVIGNSGALRIGTEGEAILEVNVYGGIGEMEAMIIKGQDISGYFNNYESRPINENGYRVYSSVSDYGNEAKFSRYGIFKQGTYLVYGNNEIRFGAISRSNFEGYIAGLTNNQNQAGALFDRLNNVRGIENLMTGISILAIDEENIGDGVFRGMKKTLDKISGSFIIRGIMSAINSDSEETIYSKVREIEARDKIKKLNQAWVEIGYDKYKYSGEESESVGGTESDGYIVKVGKPLKRGRNSIMGIYGMYERRGINEGEDSAAINEIEGGIYGGKYYDNKTNIKTQLGVSMSILDIKRKIELPEYIDNLESNFNTLNIKANVQGEYTINAAKEIDIRPYVGIKNSFIINGNIIEKGGEGALEVSGKMYLRSLWMAGLRIEDEKGDFKWNIRGYGGYTLIGDNPEYEIKIEKAPGEAGSMEITGMRIGAEVGLGGGIEYTVSHKATIFISGNTSYGQNLNRYYAGIGMSYRLGQTLRESVEFGDEEDEEEDGTDGRDIRAEEIKIVRLLAAEFEFGKYDLTAIARRNIKVAAEEIKKYNYLRITIEGNADIRGEEKLNKSLSIMRARAVYEELYRNGIPLQKMRYIDFKGSADPVANNITEEGRSRNRRAEIVIEYPGKREQSEPRRDIRREKINRQVLTEERAIKSDEEVEETVSVNRIEERSSDRNIRIIDIEEETIDNSYGEIVDDTDNRDSAASRESERTIRERNTDNRSSAVSNRETSNTNNSRRIKAIDLIGNSPEEIERFIPKD
jgi:predicted outer membrane repeat protein